MEFLIYGTLWFWLLVAGTIGYIIFCLETSLDNIDRDNGGGFKSTVAIVVAITLYAIFGSFEHVKDLFSYVIHNPSTILLFFGAYVFLGVVWSVVKWYFFLLNVKEDLKDKNYTHILDHIPTAKKNKARIMSWMMYWPLSGVWTLINDPMRRAFQVVFRKIESKFDAISNSVFADEKAAYEDKLAKQRSKNNS